MELPNLPSEQEWEKAARGTDGRAYPWGNEFNKNKCNMGESGIKSTNEITKYPEGISPYGCWDMSGNVWEWTNSLYDLKREYRVLRGGSWSDNQSSARCAYRDDTQPNDRGNSIGFRISRTCF